MQNILTTLCTGFTQCFDYKLFKMDFQARIGPIVNAPSQGKNITPLQKWSVYYLTLFKEPNRLVMLTRLYTIPLPFEKIAVTCLYSNTILDNSWYRKMFQCIYLYTFQNFFVLNLFNRELHYLHLVLKITTL